MAQIETWFNQDLQQAVKVRYLDGNVFSADNNGNIIGVNVFDNGEPAALAGSVSATIIRSDGATVAAVGTLSENHVSVALPQSAYAIPGVISVVIKLTNGTDITTLCAVVGNVYQSTTDTVVDPGTIIPDISTLVAEIEAAVASIPADYSNLWESLAPNFASGAYSAGQFVTYDGALYQFTSDHTGSWSGTDVAQIDIGSILYTNQQDITENKNGIIGTKAVISGVEYGIFKPQPYLINSHGVWTTTVTGYHVCFPIKSGDVVRLIGGSVAGIYAFLISDNAKASTLADISKQTGYTSRFALNAYEDTGDIPVPSDANLLYITVENNNHVSQRPYAMFINGVDYSKSVRTLTTENAKNIAQCSADIQFNKRVGDLWGLRGTMPGEYSIADLSAMSHLANIDFSLFSDGYKFVHNADLTNNKNISTKYYVVSNSAQLSDAITEANTGDTITLLPGVYSPVIVRKSLNLIGKPGAIMTSCDLGSFEETQTSGIYKTVADCPITPDTVLDATHIDKGVLIPLSLKASIGDVVDNPGSYIVSSGKLYIHPLAGNVPTNRNVLAIRDDEPIISFAGASVGANCNLYLENLTIVGGSSNVNGADAPLYKIQNVFGVDCRFYYALTGNAIYLRGVAGYFQRCVAAFAYLDGFNYHKNTNTDTLSNGLEIDCIGHDNGARDNSATPSDNGSTMHDGGMIARINGIYYNNNGGNVADTSAATVSYNYGCIAFDSKAPYDNDSLTSADFWANNGTHMYLYGCRSDGDSQYNLMAANNAEILISKTEYTTHTGTITPV